VATGMRCGDEAVHHVAAVGSRAVFCVGPRKRCLKEKPSSSRPARARAANSTGSRVSHRTPCPPPAEEELLTELSPQIRGQRSHCARSCTVSFRVSYRDARKRCLGRDDRAALVYPGTVHVDGHVADREGRREVVEPKRKSYRVDPDFGPTLTASDRDSQSSCWGQLENYGSTLWISGSRPGRLSYCALSSTAMP
jgi:hypothetical protein